MTSRLYFIVFLRVFIGVVVNFGTIFFVDESHQLLFELIIAIIDLSAWLTNLISEIRTCQLCPKLLIVCQIEWWFLTVLSRMPQIAAIWDFLFPFKLTSEWLVFIFETLGAHFSDGMLKYYYLYVILELRYRKESPSGIQMYKSYPTDYLLALRKKIMLIWCFFVE